MSIEEKDRDDVMDRLLQIGGDKKFLSFDDLNRELPDNVVSPDDIEDVLQKLDASNIHVADSDERLIEQAAAIPVEDEEVDEDLELDLSAGALEKTNDPVRLYLREMGVVPLLTREGEVAIAKRIERGQIKTQKAIARSPIAAAVTSPRPRASRTRLLLTGTPSAVTGATTDSRLRAFESKLRMRLAALI